MISYMYNKIFSTSIDMIFYQKIVIPLIITSESLKNKTRQCNTINTEVNTNLSVILYKKRTHETARVCIFCKGHSESL